MLTSFFFFFLAACQVRPHIERQKAQAWTLCSMSAMSSQEAIEPGT
jgi:hypothetical protein